MSNATPDSNQRKKPRGRAAMFGDPLRGEINDSALYRSFEPCLQVKKVPIMQKNKSFPGTSRSHVYALTQNSSLVAESSSNESFTSADSIPSNVYVPLEQSPIPGEPSSEIFSDERFQTAEESALLDFTDILPDPEITNETLPSYDEQMFEVPSKEFDETFAFDVSDAAGDRSVSNFKESTLTELDKSGEPMSDIALVAKSGSKEKSLPSDVSMPVGEYVALITSEASLEAISEDTNLQLSPLRQDVAKKKLLQEELSELESASDEVHDLIAEAKFGYAESHAESKSFHEKSQEKIKQQYDKERKAYEHEINQKINNLRSVNIKETNSKLEELRKIHETQLRETHEKLLVAESLLSGKEEIESALNERIKELESKLAKREKDCLEELETVVAKCMKCEILDSARSEVERELADEKKNSSQQDSSHLANFESMEEKRAKIEQTLASTEHQLKESINQLEQLKTENEVLKSERDTLNEEIVALSSKVLDANMESADLCEKMIKLSKEKEDMESSWNDLKTLCEELQANKAEKIEEEGDYQVKEERVLIEAQIQKLNEWITEFEKAEKEMSVVKAELHAKITGLESVRSEIEKQNLEMKLRITDFEVENTSLNVKIAELQQEREISEQNLIAMKAEMAKKHAENIDLEAKILDFQRERDELKKEQLEIRHKLSEISKNEEDKSVFEAKTADLQQKIDELEQENSDLKQKNLELFSEVVKINIGSEPLSTRSGNSTLSNFQSDLDALFLKKQDLEKWSEPDGRLSLEAELDRLRRDSRFSGSFASFNLSTVLKELDARGSLTRESLPKMADMTHYLKYAPESPITENEDRSVVPSDKECTCHRSVAVQKELEKSWTERCEVEQNLASSLAENVLLRNQARHLEGGLHRAWGMMGSGVPTLPAWLQLRAHVKNLIADDALFNPSANMEETTPAPEGIKVQTSFNESDELPLRRGERSSPEGGRESPLPLVDGTCAEEELEQHLELDQNTSTVAHEIAHEILRSLRGEYSLCNDTNLSLADSTLNDCLGTENACLKTTLKNVIDEALRVKSLYERNCPSCVKLQEIVTSLQSQVQNSDSQRRSTLSFLEEQAAEREQEKDEAAQTIATLAEKLKTRERQLANKEHLESDLVQLEQQVSDLKSAEAEEHNLRIVAEEKLEQLLSKVQQLRDIIETLEKEQADKCLELEHLKQDKIQLQQQLVKVGELSLERENEQRDSFSNNLAYVQRLEEEVNKLRQQIADVGPESLALARAEMRDLELMLMRRTRQLELVQVQWHNGLSSASEELSTRDHYDATRCVTPDEMAGEVAVGFYEDLERLKERFVKHGRMEEAAIKRIKELEVASSKAEEHLSDLDLAQRKVDQLLEENETLKARMERDRRHADDKQVIACLEKKLIEQEALIEQKEDALRIEREKLVEKLRTEERLRETNKSLESELSAENSELSQLKEKLSCEHERHAFAQQKLRELEEKLAQSEASLNSSKNSSKKVRFHNPPSFVTASMSPIHDESVLRDAPSNMMPVPEWTAHEPLIRKPMPWDSLSVAALQLSPRGDSMMSEDSLNPQLTTPTRPTQHRAQQTSADQTDATPIRHVQHRSLQTSIVDTSKQALEEKLTQTTKRFEEAKSLLISTQLANEDLQKRLEEVENVSKDMKSRFEPEIQRLKAEVQSEKSLNTKLTDEQSQLIKVLEKQQNDMKSLQSMLKKTADELSLVSMRKVELEKIANQCLQCDLLRRDIETTNIEVKRLAKERDQLVSSEERLRGRLDATESDCAMLKTELDNASFELNRLRREKEILKATEAGLRNKLDVNEAMLAGKLDEIETSKLVLDDRERVVRSLKEEIAVRDLKLAESEEVVKDLKEKIREVEAVRNELQNEIDAARLDASVLQSERNFLAGKLRESSVQETEEQVAKEELDEAILKLSRITSCLGVAMDRCSALEAQLADEKHLKDELTKEIQDLRQRVRDMTSNSPIEADDIESKLNGIKLAEAQAVLARAKTKESELKRQLRDAITFGKDAISRQEALQDKLIVAEQELVKRINVGEAQTVKIRGLERLCQQVMACPVQRDVLLESRGVRSAGDVDVNWQYAAQRVESHRKALVYQKQLLLRTPALLTLCPRSQRSRRRRPTLKTVAIMIVAICRMRFVVRRWRLPPISSPRRHERPLSLVGASPPCKDTGLLN